MLTNVRFLRTIPYISNWFNREIQSLYMLRKERKIEFSGKTIINEGDPCDKVIIVLKGEVEIVKTNLSTIFFNQATRTLGMKEYREKGMMVQSEFVFDPNEEGVAAQLGVISSQAQYTGTLFHFTIQHQLSQNIDTKLHFKDKHKSQFNQQSIKEVQV